MENELSFGKPTCDPVIESCHFQIDPPTGVMTCAPGNASCSAAEFLEASESCFHTIELIEATRAINAILASIPESPSSSLAILHLKQGTMLAMVEHGGKEIEGAITAESDPEVLAKHLKLSK